MVIDRTFDHQPNKLPSPEHDNDLPPPPRTPGPGRFRDNVGRDTDEGPPRRGKRDKTDQGRQWWQGQF